MDVLLVILCIGAGVGIAIMLITKWDRHETKARENFSLAASVQPRSFVERLIANCNSLSSSTFFEAQALIERDASKMDAEFKSIFLNPVLNAETLEVRIQKVREVLETHYLPKAIANEGAN